MKFLFASDSFKGTLSSRQTAELLTQAAGEVFPGCGCSFVEMADGGEGTVDAVLSAAGGHMRTINVHDPLGRIIRASYGILPDKTAVIEMAAASGLPLVPSGLRDPRRTTSYGTGELIADALAQIRSIDLSGMDPLIRGAEFTIMCDVTNPLCGETGATYTFGKQKGGTPEILNELEAGMRNYRDILLCQSGVNMDEVPGSGAAGGLGAALMVFLNGKLKSGIETVLDLTGFDEKLADVDLVITGEGRADGQSVCGKVMQGVGLRCRKYGIPAVAIVGSMGPGAEVLFDFGIESIITTVNGIMPLEEALEKERVMRIELTYPAWKAGVLPLNYTRIISDTIGILSQIVHKCKHFFLKSGAVHKIRAGGALSSERVVRPVFSIRSHLYKKHVF